MATYIFNDDAAALGVAATLRRAAERGVAVHVVVDGFGSLGMMPGLRALFAGSGVRLEAGHISWTTDSEAQLQGVQSMYRAIFRCAI